MKPIIGITTGCEQKAKKIYSLVSKNYVDSVIKAGGAPVLIPFFDDIELAKTYLDSLDGLILSGGFEDVCPLAYGENPIPEVNQICEKRDRIEFALMKEAYKRDLPMLGICRGMQVMNVALGGSLYQDIFKQVEGTLGHLPRHIEVHNLYQEIEIKKDTKLYKIFGAEEIKINSFHHQAIKKVASQLVITAKAADGIIEAVESPTRKFTVGVQWHPEDLTSHHEEFIGLFKGLVDAAR